MLFLRFFFLCKNSVYGFGCEVHQIFYITVIFLVRSAPSFFTLLLFFGDSSSPLFYIHIIYWRQFVATFLHSCYFLEIVYYHSFTLVSFLGDSLSPFFYICVIFWGQFVATFLLCCHFWDTFRIKFLYRYHFCVLYPVAMTICTTIVYNILFL